MAVTVDELLVADSPDAWSRAGFCIDPDAVCRVGGVAIRLAGREHGTGIVGWALGGLPPSSTSEGDLPGVLDGIPTVRSNRDAVSPAAHPNGTIGIDHVVLMSPDLVRTVAALATLGLQPRRQRDAELGGRPIRQVFFRCGEVIVEVVGAPGSTAPGPASLWGITYVVADIDATAAFFAGRTGPVKDAVQPGRRITTLRHHDLGMSVRTAMISASR